MELIFKSLKINNNLINSGVGYGADGAASDGEVQIWQGVWTNLSGAFPGRKNAEQISFEVDLFGMVFRAECGCLKAAA